jgi:hypothetical protein
VATRFITDAEMLIIDRVKRCRDRGYRYTCLREAIDEIERRLGVECRTLAFDHSGNRFRWIVLVKPRETMVRSRIVVVELDGGSINIHRFIYERSRGVNLAR